ncbi:PXA domain-containing protein [Aphelenchoides avenae]|nr:PXA domain-containing protein [Aphelenchus avenae]
MYDEKHSMANSEVIDPVLEQILEYIMRDFVDSWYSKFTSDHLLQESLKRVSRRTIAAFSQWYMLRPATVIPNQQFSVKKVDWVPLMTKQFIDDFASHLRLYRMTKDKLSHQRMKSEGKHRPDDLETVFFDLELEMEKRCRDLVSTSPMYESAYLHDLVDILLYLLMPSEDFRSRPLRFLLREVIVTRVMVPLLDKLSQPDYLNFIVVWLLSEVPINTDDFVATLETSDSVQELEAILEAVHDEVNALRSKDIGGEYAAMVKQELESLSFVERVIKRRMITLTSEPEDAVEAQPLYREPYADAVDDSTVVALPIRVVLTNSVATTYFVEFLSQVGGQNYIDCYLAIEGFKASVEHQLRGLRRGDIIDAEVYETIKEAGLFMYHKYLSREAVSRVEMDDAIVNKFLARLRTDADSDTWFEQIEEKIVETLAQTEEFYPAFRKSPEYVKMLEELGILTDEDRTDAASDGGMSQSQASETAEESLSETASGLSDEPAAAHGGQAENHIRVLIETLGVGQQGTHMFALYNIRVWRTDQWGKNSSSWNVIRRYSDFYTLNTTVVSLYPNLKTVPFPGKRTFNNLDQHFLEKRCDALNSYMKHLLRQHVLAANRGLEAEILNFLSQKRYTGSQPGLSKKVVSAMFNPIVSGVKAFGTAVTAVPDQVYDGVTKVGSEINKAASSVLNPSSSARSMSAVDSKRVAAHIVDTDHENIPLRVILLMVDEVFGLRGRNQWFRRRLVALLRQFLNATLGSSINQRILNLVRWLTSEEMVAQYLAGLRDSLWPGGQRSTEHFERPHSESLRTRLLARCMMLSALPDELRLFIGASTTSAGINNVSEALQNKHLNRRLCYVILENLLEAIFPKNHFKKVLPMLHSKSPRANIA